MTTQEEAAEAMQVDPPFSLELLSEPLLSFTKEALTANPETAANKYNVLEAQLRGHLLSLVAENNLELLEKEWSACWNICIHLLQENTALAGFIRKLPFVLLEDVVECLSTKHLEPFYTSLDTTTLFSTGPLWSLPALNTSHVLQYIRLQNTLLQKLPKHFAGKILMEMSNSLSLSDRSALKLWGSVSGREIDEYDEEEDQEQESLVSQQQEEQERSFHETFWSVQEDMQNPYKIHFSHFFTCCKQILAALESNHSNMTTISLSNNTKYLTKRSLLSLQLQDATFCQQWLTQFLICTSFLTWQSTRLESTLQELTNRAKALLKKLPNGPEYLSTLEETLFHSEVYWRTWKQQKCKPDMEKSAPPNDTTIESRTSVFCAPAPLHNKTLCLQDLQETAKSMAVPSLDVYLQEYVEALDPQAGIEAAYHPRKNALYCWRSLRLLGRDHLEHFGDISKNNGDFERMVRAIYQQKGVDIPGQGPEAEVEMDHDENIGQTETEVKVDTVKDEQVEHVVDGDVDETMEDTVQDHGEESLPDQDEAMKDLNDDGVDDEGIEPTPAESESEQKEEVNTSDDDKDESRPDDEESPVNQEIKEQQEVKEQVKEQVKEEEAKPAKPLTPFEQAALEEEEILLANDDEMKEKNPPVDVKSEATDTKPKVDAPKKDTKRSTASQDSKSNPVVDRKRKRGTSDGTSTTETTKRPRTGNKQGRNTSDQSQQSQRRQDNRGPAVISFRDMDRPHPQQGGGVGHRGGGGRGGAPGGRGQQPARRSPPPVPGTGPTRQPPLPGVGERGRDGGGRGRSGGRGGGGRGPPQRRDSSRRRY